MQAAYNTPMSVAFTPSWKARNNPNPNPNSAKNWQTVSNGASGEIRTPRRLNYGAQASIAHESAQRMGSISAQDTAILGNTSGKTGGHAGTGR